VNILPKKYKTKMVKYFISQPMSMAGEKKEIKGRGTIGLGEGFHQHPFCFAAGGIERKKWGGGKGGNAYEFV